MTFFVSMHPDDSAVDCIYRIDSLAIFATSAQEAVDKARNAFPAYAPYRVRVDCTDWS